MSSLALRCERCLLVAVLLLLLWLPLPLGSNREWAVGLFVAGTGLLAAVWTLLQWTAARQSRGLKVALPMFGLLIATQAWVAVQGVAGLSMDVGATVQYLLLGTAYSLLFLLVVNLFHSRRRLVVLLGMLATSGTLQAFYGAFMTLSDIEWLLATPKTSYIGDATGTFVNRNHLAGYLEMTLAVGIGLLLALRDVRPFRWVNLLEMLMGAKARLRLALVVMVIALVMTHSRMGNTAFFSALMIVGGLFMLRDRDNRFRNGLILASILLVDVLVISQYFGLEKLKDRLINTRLNDVLVEGQVVQRENVDRDDIFVYAMPLATEKLLSGHGAGSFEAVFPQYPGEDIRTHFDHAHNDYLQFVIEYGLIGSLPLLAFALLALWRAFQALWRLESLFRSGVGFGAATGIIAIAIHSATDFNLQIPANAATFIVLCAIAVLANHHNTPGTTPGRLPD
ncbi:O-antigen ligase domain-containing protein [Azotobacter chroococcum]|nr:O-antigen ligase domain-containing protein [Azotobacter chroococcum]